MQYTKTFLLALLATAVQAFAPLPTTTVQRTALFAVKDVTNEGDFDKIVKGAGSALVIVDYSTTWCGPCKVIAPKFEEFSEKYSDAIFLKVIGDASPEASKLMKREGVRSVPSFHYFVNGEKIDVVNGANAEAIEAAITKHVHTA